MALIASMLDSSLSDADVEYFAKKETVSAQVELFDDDQAGWIRLAECQGNNLSPLSLSLMSKRKETPGEKFKRKLKEKQEKRRKAQEEERKKKKGRQKKRKSK